MSGQSATLRQRARMIGLSPTEIAAATGVSRLQVHRVLRGDGTTTRTLGKIENVIVERERVVRDHLARILVEDAQP